MSAIRIGICGLLAFAVVAFGGTQVRSAAILEIGAAGLFLLWGIVAIKRRQAEIHRNWLYLPVLALIVFCCAQELFGLSAYPYATKIELLKWTGYFLVSFLAVETFRTTAQLRSLAVFLVSLSFLVALFAIVQRYAFNGSLYWFFPLPQPSEPFGPFVDRDHFAGFVELTAPLGLAMLLYHSWRREKVALLALFTGVPIAALILSGSRGGIAGFIAATLLLFLLSRLHVINGRRIFGFASLMVLVGVFAGWLGAGVTIQRFEKLTLASISRDRRISLDRDTWRIFVDHPWNGTGLGTFETIFPQYETDYDGRAVDHAHNDYLELLAETGTIGGILGLAFIVLLFLQGLANLHSHERQSNRAFYAGSLAACSALFIHSLVDFNLHIPSNALFFLFLATRVTTNIEETPPTRLGNLV